MTEKRFTIDENKIKDNQSPYSYIEYYNGLVPIVDLLNGLAEENNELRLQLNLCSDQRDEFHRGARENANHVGELLKENEQLKQFIQELTTKGTGRIDLADGNIYKVNATLIDFKW